MIKLANLDQKFDKLGIDREKGYAFLVLLEVGLEQFLLRNNLINPESAMVLISLEDGEYVPRFQVFEQDTFPNHEKLIQLIVEEGVLNSKGYLNNQMEYVVISSSKEEKKIFNSLEIDVEKAYLVIKNHYMNTKMALKLENYLKGGFMLDYKSF